MTQREGLLLSGVLLVIVAITLPELGVIGLALYAWLLAGAAVLILRLRGRDEALALGLGVTLLGLFTHALFYSGFLEDPLTWLVIAIAAAYCAEPQVERRRRREVAPA